MTNYQSKIKAVLKEDGLGELSQSEIIIINNMLNRMSVVTEKDISEAVYSYIDGIYNT